MITDQAEQLRLLVRRTKKCARVIAFTSGKGGVGKTNIAANFAICVAAAGKDVILIDADLSLANVDVLLNVKARNTIADVVAGKKRLEEIMYTGPGGLRVICGASGLSELAELGEFQRQRVLQEICSLEQQADVIVVDTGAGISRDVMAFAETADHTVVVTTGEPTSMTDAYAMIKLLTRHAPEAQLSVLVNQATSRQEARSAFQRMAGVARQFLAARVLDAGYVLTDPKVKEAVRKREPFVLAYPRCPASRCMAALATKLRSGGSLVERRESFFKRVANWFA